MKDKPLVSVILTSFNHEKYLREAIDSVLNQTFKDFELIIWDDASSDNSWRVINEYDDPRIKAFRNEVRKRGIWGINKAIAEVAAGKYIAIHHSDDIWETKKLGKQVAFLDANDGIGAVFSNATVIAEDGSPLADEKHPYFNIFDQPNKTRYAWLNQFLYQGNALCHPSVLIRKSCYADCGFYRFGFAQVTDFDMWIRLCLKHEIYILPDRLVRFRVRDNEANASGNRPETRIRLMYESYKALEHYKEIKRFEDLVKIFPTAEKYDRKKETDMHFVLAMVALEGKPFTFTQLFGLDLLFEVISDPIRSVNIKRLYDFDYMSFIDLTAKHDIFSREAISNLGDIIAERDKRIDGFNRALTERDRQIVNFCKKTQTLSEEMTKMEAAVTARDAQIASLKQMFSEGHQMIQTLAEQLAKKDAAVVEHDEQIAGLSQVMAGYAEALRTIEEIRGSSSWRITAPMRYVSSKIKNLVAVIKLLPSIIRFGGGIAGSAGKAWRVFFREGWGGIKRRILFVGGNRNGFISSKIRPDLTSAAVDRNDYTEWIRRYDSLTSESRAAMRDRIENFPLKPLISVLMPVYNPKQEWLIEAIASIHRQIYPYWELCIADDASTDKGIRPLLESYAKEDPRVKIIFRKKNGHISAASNSALQLAAGEWVALLDQDDLLAEHALFCVADAINQNPDACLIYSDEDKINDSGMRSDPYFKCDWNVDLFYSHNLITHLGVYGADLLKEIGGFREGLEGSQDYDLALRCIERIEPKQIHHIPRVLYHWRMHVGSTAKSGNAKPYALSAGKTALDEHFQRQGVSAAADLLDFGMYRIRYALPDKLPLVSLIIPTRNGLLLLQRCVESILKKTTYPNYEILIVDNGSDDPETIQYLKKMQSDPKIRVVRDDRPFNYSALNNAAVKLARGEVVGLLNNDLEVISFEWLSEMVSHALRPGVGAVGARLWYPDETLQHGGVVLGLGGIAGHAHCYMPRHHYGYLGRASVIQSFSAVTAACLVIRKSVYEEVGGFNEDDLQVAFNDVDFCLRVGKAGYRNIWTPYAEFYHYESATRGYENTPERQKRFTKEVDYMKQQWNDVLLSDPAYSPNLTLDHQDFGLAWPPRVGLFLHPADKVHEKIQFKMETL